MFTNVAAFAREFAAKRGLIVPPDLEDRLHLLPPPTDGRTVLCRCGMWLFETSSQRHYGSKKCAEGRRELAARLGLDTPAAPAEAEIRTETPTEAEASRALLALADVSCGYCKCSDSPQWRKGPPEHPVLCNACGIRYARSGRLDPVNAGTWELLGN